MINDTAKARIAKFLYNLEEERFRLQDGEVVGIHDRDWSGDTPLKIAVVNDNVQIVADLLAAGADPNIIGEDDCTPIHHAASHGHCDIIRLLLSHGARTDLVCMLGTPAHLARHYPEAYALLTQTNA